MTIISQENLLGYVKGNKLWHDNSQKSNTFLSYYMDNWYWHEFRQWTPPVPPTPTTITMSFNSSSPFLAEPIPSITLSSEDTNTLIVDSNTYTIGVFVNWVQQYTVDPEFIDEWCSIYAWMGPNGAPMVVDASISITDSWTYTPLIQRWVIHRDTQWPCPDGYHIGTKDERQELLTALTIVWAYDVNYIKTYLKIPDAYYLARSSGKKETKYWTVRMWTSTMDSNTVAYVWWIDENNKFVFQADKPGNGFSIRPFKDTAVDPFDWTWPAPDEPGIWWTTIIRRPDSYDWIYWHQTKWIITIRGGSYLYTMSDKNLWATNVWDNWLFYQFWNNSWYTYNASPYVTSKPTISSSYWPGNYYTWSFVRVSSGNNWFNWTNNNLWWWVTNGTWTDPV